MLETELPKQDLSGYYKDLMIRIFGVEDYWRIIEALEVVPNGFCGVEMYYATFPGLLKAKGVKPDRDYLTEYKDIGPPKENGKQAATPEQRKVIWNALKEAGFEIE